MEDRQKEETNFSTHKCPVCNGFGTLSYGKKKCHACNGKGYLIINEDTGLPVKKDRQKDENENNTY